MSTILSDTPEEEPFACPVCGHQFAPDPAPPLWMVVCPKCQILLEVFPGKDAVILSASTRWKYKSRAELEAGGEWNESDRKISSGKRGWITGGTFENFEGTVVSIDESKREARVEIDVFGRITSVNLKFSELEVFG